MANAPVDVKKASAPSRGEVADPWRPFRGEMDRLFERFGFPSFRRMLESEPFWSGGPSLSVTAPAVDITEDEKAYKLTAELPGMAEKDIDVSVTGDLLVLRGEKRAEREEKEKNRFLSERNYGAFQRNFVIPDGVDRDKIGAEFAKGVLTLTLPKSVEAQKQQKKIEIKTS